MIFTYVCVGAPASGKSTWAKSKVAEDPDNWVRVNNDDIRSMLNGSVWSADYEKLVSDTRTFLIREAFKREKNVILDNVNAHPKHWDEVVKLAKAANRDITVEEKPFFIELQDLISRDAARAGKAQVGEKVIKKFWNDLGREEFKNYAPRTEVFSKNLGCKDMVFVPANQDKSLPGAVICDLDGTLSLFVGKRSPYDAVKCDEDDLNEPVAEVIKLLAKDGTKVIFCSGREDKYLEPTKRFIAKHLPGLEYKLFMRKSADMRKDAIVKEEIYRGKIEGKYWVKFVMDDRTQVVNLWRETLGLTCFQVAPGNF